MRKLLAIIIGSLATAVVSAGPTVTDVVAKQRYPWNGLVDITCKVTGISGTANGLIFDVAAVMPDSSNGRNVSHLWVVRDGIKLIDRTVHGNGNYQLLWDAQADLGQTTCSNMVIRVTVRDIHGKVQLWKGGPYWAETNIGAGEPWERGYYFWWGDTTGHKWENGVWTGNFMFKNGSFEDPTYPYAPFWQVMYKSDSELMSSSWVEKKSWYEGDRGITTYTLMPEHDAAQVHWGGDWHVPTFDELQDLFDRCDWRWCTTNGVNGFVVHSSDDWDKSIFLPCTGWGVGQDLLSENVYGHYWLSNSSYPDGLSGDDQVSQSLNFGRSFRRHDRHIRGYGLPIRPVQRFSNMVENAGEALPFPLDTTTSLDMIVPLVDLLLIPWNAAWIGGDANATVVIMDNGTEVKRTTGAGEFTYMPAEIGRHDLTYTTLIGDVVQDETYTANFYAKWKYKIVDGGAVITATTQKSGDVTIPDVLNGYPVKGIANDVFKGCDSLTSVTVPESVTDIGTRAFIENRNLHRIVLPVWLKGLIDESACSGNADDVEIVYIDGVGIYVNAPDMDFREPEDCLWSGDMNTSHAGIASARLKGMGQDSESSIELYLDSPGRLSFWWKASSESDGNNVFDYAYLSIDGVPQGTLNKENYSLNGVAIGGKTGWRQEVIDVVGKGSHVIRWTYAKDEIDEGDTGDDCVWLDEVEFTPLAYLSFDIAGASGTAPSEISELEGTVVTLPAQIGFEWEDHVFNGWSDGKATYAAESQYVVPASNVTLTAQWIAKRFLTFSLDGGEGQIPITIKDVPGADITLPSANGVSRGKHVFVGWSDGAMTYDAGANYRVTDASVEFKAVWKRKEAHVSIASDDVVNGGTVDTAGATISMSAWSNPSVGTPAIYYTLDGTEPTTGSTRYEEPFFVDVLGDVTVTALAVLDGCFDDEATFSFTRLPYSLCECVAMEGVNVAVGGAAPWFRVTGEGAHDGKAALRSGAIGDGESSCVEMQVRGEVEVSL